MKKFVQFALLIAFMMLLNLFGHLIGLLFIEKYAEHVLYFYFWDSLFFTSIYSVLQIFVFPINKKYRVFIIPIFTLLLVSFMIFNDPTGFGNEIVHDIISLVSKIIYIIYFLIAYNIEDTSMRILFENLLYSLGYGLYLLMVFSSFKYIMKHFGNKFSLFAVGNKKKASKTSHS
ncbi:hypothetical protein LJC11_05290 [Bacteroidales bacterium OttesenSCG-928-I21]|nr:hypothetical protein [Bacteroidales bacterium OttesenSCG-928-I21]